MLLDILGMGILVAMSLFITFCRMGWHKKLWVLSHHAIMDIAIATLLMVTHWGSFTGPMVAGAGTLVCQLMLWGGKAMFGHVDKNGKYWRGMFDMWNKIKPPEMPITNKREFL